MDDIDLVFAVAGAGALVAAWVPGLIQRLPLSLPAVFLLGGAGLYLLPLPFPDPDPVAHRILVEHLTEVCVVVSLMGAGLALNRPFGSRNWAVTWRLLGVAMPLTIAGVAVAAYALLGWPVAAALLLGAVLAPTDPVLASDVQVAEPADPDDDDPHDDDEVRFGLTSEAGLNDGLAFPVVYAAIAVAGAGGGIGWIAEWFGVDLLARCAIGVASGLAVGWLLGRMFFRGDHPQARLAERNEGFVALAATLLAYGVTEVMQGYGFIAVFTTACTIRAGERSHGYHGVLHGFIDQVERLFTAWLLLLLGGFVAIGGLAELTWQGAAVGLLLLLVIRPVSAWAAQLGGAAGPRERGVIAFFGIRGIGSLFYLAYALGHAGFGVPPQELWAVVTFTIVVSVCLHGLAATPIMTRLDRLRATAG